MKCGPTKKVMFKTRRGAEIRAQEILDEESNRKYKVNSFRIYHCIYCNSYHLTTKPLSKFATNLQIDI
jgi:hypothetical protein